MKLTVLALVAVLAGCGGGEGGGSEQNQSSTQKPDNSEGGQAAKPTQQPAEKFTTEMVKEALAAAQEQLPDFFSKGASDKMKDPEALKEFVDILNKQIVDGKINDPVMKIDAITVDALTEAMVTQLPEAKKRENIYKSTNNAKQLMSLLISCMVNSPSETFPSSNKWCDAALPKARTFAIFYSPQHPDTPKLRESLPKLKPATTEPAEPSASTKPPAPVPEKPSPLPNGNRVSHYAMNKAMSGKGYIGADVVLVFECDLGWNGAGGLDDALKYMNKFKLEKIAVATPEGSSGAVTRDELKKLKWVPLE